MDRTIRSAFRIRGAGHAPRDGNLEVEDSNISTTTSQPCAPIFVVGYQHTGTTLMQYILGRNPQVFSVRHESKYFEYLELTQRRYPDLSAAPQREAFVRYVAGVVEHGYPVRGGSTVDGYSVAGLDVSLTSEEVARLADEVGKDPVATFRAVNDVLARRQGKSRWLEKTPSHVFQLRDILDWMPDARAVGMVRDPRDSLASKKSKRLGFARNARVREEQRKNMNLQLGYDILLDSVSLRSAVRVGQILEHEHPDRFLTVRYEELVGEPAETVSAVCEFLGLAFDPSMLDVTATAGERKITSERVGRWAGILSAPESAICQSVLRKEMRTYGYEEADVSVGARIRSAGLLVRSAVDFLRRLWRKLQLGGPGYLLNVVRNWVKRWSGSRAVRPRQS